MALLLAMYQKLRLIRERNQLTLEMTQGSSKLSRIEKNIERTQKYYTSLFKQVEDQAKRYQNMATTAINSMAGIGVGYNNPLDYTGMGNAFVSKFMNDILGENGTGYGKKGEEKHLDGTTFQEMAEYLNANGSFKAKEGEEAPFSDENIALFNAVKSAGYQAQQQAQANASMLSSQVQNNISIWADAMRQHYENEQDAALEPLTYEQTMLELDKTLKENRLKRIEAELESYSQLVDKGAEEMAPKFGLG